MKQLKNNLQEPHVSYLIAKLLKEKGFEVNTLAYFSKNGQIGNDRIGNLGSYDMCYEQACYQYGDNILYAAPTHALAIMWIRENFDKVITVYANASGYLFEIHDSAKLGGSHRYDSDYSGPNDSGCWDKHEEAESAAITYTLQNLIK